ncbi:MAG: hypothetical protein M0Q13_11705 [Methanothrix sp.]|jgi:hypothetical protein|nr:hypothetical protein [Methanothrix sp.]
MKTDNLNVDIEQFTSLIYRISVGEDISYNFLDAKLSIKGPQNGNCRLEIYDSDIYDNRVIIMNGTFTQMGSASDKLRKFISKDYIKNKYDINIRELRELNHKMKVERGEVKRKIEELSKWTLLPGTLCERVKDFKIKE